MNIGWPEGIYLALQLFGFGYIAAKHGQPRDPYHAGYAFTALCISVGLVWWGGFFA